MTDAQNSPTDDGGGEVDRVVLVQCTDLKRDGKHMARDLYDESDYFKKQRAYAEAVGDRWFVQSAEYGLVNPDDTIEYYDKHASDLADSEGWAEQIAQSLDSMVGTPTTVEILGGMAYADPLTPELERRGYDVHEPLSGQQIGERMASLDEMVQHA